MAIAKALTEKKVDEKKVAEFLGEPAPPAVKTFRQINMKIPEADAVIIDKLRALDGYTHTGKKLKTSFYDYLMNAILEKKERDLKLHPEVNL